MKNFLIAISITAAIVLVMAIIMTSIPSEDLFRGRSAVVENRTGMEVIGGSDNNFILVDSQGICYRYIMGGSPSSSQLIPYYKPDGTAMTIKDYKKSQGVE